MATRSSLVSSLASLLGEVLRFHEDLLHEEEEEEGGADISFEATAEEEGDKNDFVRLAREVFELFDQDGDGTANAK